MNSIAAVVSFLLDSDLDRWLPHRKSINDGTPCTSLSPLYWFLVYVVTRLLSHPLIVDRRCTRILSRPFFVDFVFELEICSR
ncbi:hypothetical protein BHE74_00037343 [Ensete ventricosum]|nr:hypothetical protein GW17_00049646 [Ensete ventricosum]RWW55970.1 hypothetical protein BHE74_00037343 [Ensete ventricosum]RZR99396.1 hypothetical protein BHM03_00028920 [Ensete ventricosum]